jgi:hypothetical protein
MQSARSSTGTATETSRHRRRPRPRLPHLRSDCGLPADYLRTAWGNIGAAVIGRRLFDLTNGWGGRPAIGEAVFVVTHQAPGDWSQPDAPFTFVTDGLRSAIPQAQVFAGHRDVALPTSCRVIG